MSTVSVVIPTLNGVGRIEQCLNSVIRQSFAREKIQIIVVDDLSTDATVSVCRALGVDEILISGDRDIERSKSIGLQSATGDFVLLIDDDNELVDRDWLATSVEILQRDHSLGGIQSIRFAYRPEDPLANRYCSLMGINDPLVYYLKRSDRLALFEDGWPRIADEVHDRGEWMKVRFGASGIPTLGSQGFLTRTSLIKEFASGARFYHLDFCHYVNLSESPFFALRLDSVRHDHCKTVASFVAKCRRNGRLYLRDGRQRQFSYDMTTADLMKLALLSVTVVVPLVDAIRGYKRQKDVAWFLHPILTPWILVVYAELTLRHRLRLLFAKTND